MRQDSNLVKSKGGKGGRLKETHQGARGSVTGEGPRETRKSKEELATFLQRDKEIPIKAWGARRSESGALGGLDKGERLGKEVCYFNTQDN